jgi:hypothetical protein
MSNKSYCRFENTLSDLRDCYMNMDEGTNPEETVARKELIELCMKIADEYKEEI